MSVVLLLAALGCEGQIHGYGQLYLWNGTENNLQVEVKGRTEMSTRILPASGQLFDEVVAGPYQIIAGDKTHELEMLKERLTVLNAEGVGCFARTDVIGMYQRGKAPVRVLQLYEGFELETIEDQINVLPGERLPAEAPRKPFAYQRLTVIPCTMLEGDHPEETVADFVRRLR